MTDIQAIVPTPFAVYLFPLFWDIKARIEVFVRDNAPILSFIIARNRQIDFYTAVITGEAFNETRNR